MTAEIVVMNRQAVALAADSAVTLGGGAAKIYASANKIFAFSKYHPVGVMIFGNATLLGVPWESIIKTYRRELKTKGFRSLQEYADDLASWLGNNHHLFPADVQREYVTSVIGDYFREIVEEIRSRVQERILTAGSVTDAETKRVVADVVELHHDMWEDADDLPLAPHGELAEVTETYVAVIVREINESFEKLPVTDEVNTQLIDLAVALVSKIPPTQPQGVTGVVVAGFGTDDVFPSFSEFIVDGVANDRLISWPGRSSAIHRGMDAYVGAFAQSEMVTRFMEGVDPEYQGLLEQSLQQILRGYTNEMYKLLGGRAPAQNVRAKIDEARDQMLEDYLHRLRDVRQQRFVSSVLSAVSSLPVDELADMAEALVNLTSFKRRVSMELESVGGPIDVAVITPGDGFVWIKRKHYFEPERNPHFFANYYRED